MAATKNAHDWHCEDHDTYGWRGEECRKCPTAPSEADALRNELNRLVDKQMTKTRYRLGKDGWIFGKPVLILQVLEKYGDGPSDENGLPQFLAGERWRDATVEDLQVKE